MERLLVLKLDAAECEAEAVLNGIPIARADASRPRMIVPAHEYMMAGNNRLELVVWPRPTAAPANAPAAPPLRLVSNGLTTARTRILLPRIGSVIDESTCRTLAELEWGLPQGVSYTPPLSLTQDVTLPVTFPRWRWMDAPPLELRPELVALVFGFVQALAEELARGETDRFMSATRLRTEEIAIAYQRRPEDDAAALREHLQAAHAAGSLAWQPLQAEAFVLRPLAGGRLFECLNAEGQPALLTQPGEDGSSLAFPLRVTVIDQKVYVLR